LEKEKNDPGFLKISSIFINYIIKIIRLFFIKPIIKIYKKIIKKTKINNKKYLIIVEKRRNLFRFYRKGERLDTPLDYNKNFFINYISNIFNNINLNIFLFNYKEKN
jgi:hypothetical protein